MRHKVTAVALSTICLSFVARKALAAAFASAASEFNATAVPYYDIICALCVGFKDLVV